MSLSLQATGWSCGGLRKWEGCSKRAKGLAIVERKEENEGKQRKEEENTR